MSKPSFELTEMVRAGAGAGKTTQLTDRVVEVAQDFYKIHRAWPKLMVTTFTRKATQELRERLITKACQMERGDLLEYVSSPAKLHISTLHGIFSHFLRNYFHLLGRDSQFTTLTEEEAHRLAKKTLSQIVFSGDPFLSLIEAYGFEKITDSLLRLLKFDIEFQDLKMCDESDFQRVFHLKSRDYAWRFSHILKNMDDFHSPSWVEYKTRIHEMISSLETGKAMDLKTGIENLGRKPRRPQGACEETDRQLKETVEGFKKWFANSHPLSWEEFTALSGDFEKLFQIFKKDFQSLKSQTGQLEISDLELLAYQVTQKNPPLAEHFSREWHYWFVDEYQDTSPLQVKILEGLMGNSPSFIVGDPQQSIYLFRGARSEVFDARKKQTLDRGGQLRILDKNYRSRPELLYFLNDFFSKISPHFSPMKPRDSKETCPIVATYSIADSGEKGCNEEARKNEEIAIYNHIRDLLRKGERYEGICVLARTHNHLNSMASFLDSRGLPTHIHSSSGFHERREIMDALSLLKFIINPHDNFNLIRVLRAPWFHVDDQTLVEGLSSQPPSYWKTLSSTFREHKSFQSLRQLLQRASVVGISETFQEALISCGIFDLVRKHDPSGRRESNLWKLVTQLEIEEKRPGFNYLKFINSLWRGEWGEGGDAVACLEPNRINLMTIHASKGLKFRNIILPRIDRKPLLTTSSSRKPLINVDEQLHKWTLAVPLGDEKKISHSPVAVEIFERQSQWEREENDRLLYVALTRAEESVFLSWIDDVERGSWADKIQIPLENGIVTRENYSFKIQRGSWEEAQAPDSSFIESPAKPRDPYKRDFEPMQKRSVSEILEEEKGETGKKEGTVESFLKAMRSASDGTLIHKMMESLVYGKNIDYKSWPQEWFKERQEAISFVQNLTTPPMQQLLNTGFAEWGFQMKSDQGVIEGQIDLWGEVENSHGEREIWIIDYKSGSENYVEKAFKQIDFYAKALKAYGLQGPIKKAVIYPLKGLVEVRS